MSKQIPIIGSVTEQKLIITFAKQENGEGAINFDFEPPIAEAISPEQRAAVNVAEQIIKMFGLDVAKAEKEKKNAIIQ
jgi:hypothetical protein